MSNELVHLNFTLDIPEEVCEKLIGRPDDGSDDYYQEIAEKLQAAVADEPSRFLEYVTDTEVEIVA